MCKAHHKESSKKKEVKNVGTAKLFGSPSKGG